MTDTTNTTTQPVLFAATISRPTGECINSDHAPELQLENVAWNTGFGCTIERDEDIFFLVSFNADMTASILQRIENDEDVELDAGQGWTMTIPAMEF